MTNEFKATLRNSLEICSSSQSCEGCIYEDSFYPECMKKLMAEACTTMSKLLKSNLHYKARIKTLKEEKKNGFSEAANTQ